LQHRRWDAIIRRLGRWGVPIESIRTEHPQVRVIPPFLKRPESRNYAAKASFCFGVMPPMAMLGRS
jgi:hypothetical protein